MTDPRVLLTGFPGFLGTALVERLLARGDGPVACLVESRFRERAQRRVRAIVDDGPGATADGGAATVDPAAIRLYEGDVTAPDCGLADGGPSGRSAARATGASLPDELGAVRECYHLAAVYDLGVDAALAEAVNVRGTERVLDVAERLGVERFHHVSTCYVSGRYDGVFTEAHLREGQSFNNPYEASKYRAEVAVREHPLPATVYRPAIVVGDSETGATEKYDGLYYLLCLLLQQSRRLAVVPTVPGAARAEFNVVPRDYVVDAIAHLGARPDAAGETYQLCDPAPPTVPRLLELLGAATGRRLCSPTLPKPVVRRLVAALAARDAPVEPAGVDYLDHPTRYAGPNARRALAGTGIDPPSLPAYLDRLVAFVREHPDGPPEPALAGR